jgi:hypothetical protein
VEMGIKRVENPRMLPDQAMQPRLVSLLHPT